MKDRIQSWASVLLGAAVVVLVGWLAVDGMGRPRGSAREEAGVDAGGDAGGVIAVAASDAGGEAVVAGMLPGSGTGTGTGTGTFGLGMAAGFETDAAADAGVMPSGAPRSVRLGVVLVQWAGAEGAGPGTRAKADAQKRAVELAELARTDWKGAVRGGDSGSTEDMGRVPRGVLDRTTEVAVFSLGASEISEPLETPRGYWIVKRVE